MNDWIARYAAALAGRLDGQGTPASLTAETVELVLDLARVVAHGTERKNAPLATYLAGAFASARVAQGGDVLAAVREALSMVQEVE